MDLDTVFKGLDLDILELKMEFNFSPLWLIFNLINWMESSIQII